MAKAQGNADAAGKSRLRVAKFLGEEAAIVRAAAEAGKLLIEKETGATIAAAREAVEAMARDGLIARSGGRIALSPAGVALLKRATAPEEPFLAQHREVAEIRIELPEGPGAAVVNLAESPLALLARRKGRDGKPFLDEREWRAGERLRCDYERGRIMPRLGANWQAAVASGRRDGGAGGIADLTDAALAARQRVDHAIEAVGPELAGVLIDVCCFLKGLETVEVERGWPVRSAKVVLKAALAALSRHYEPEPRRVRSSAVLHWGAEDYRPRIGGANS